MKLLSENFIKESNAKEDRYFKVYTHYRPNYNKPIVSGKFYSKFDQLDLTKADPVIVEDIKIAKVKIPRDKYSWPVTTSHMYGWFVPTPYFDRRDKRFYRPASTAPFVTHEMLIRCDITMKKEKFSGVPFKLG